MPALHNFRLTVLSIAASMLLLTSPLPSAAQQAKALQQTKAAPGGNLIVGTVASERGTTAAIPLYYERGKAGALHSVHVELEFVSNSVKFVRAEKGVAVEQEFDVKVESKELPPDAKKITRTRLTVDVSLSGSDPKQSLPEGLLAFLNFTIPPEAKPFSIALTPLATSAQDAAKKPLAITAEAGKIIVSVPDEPLAGCFFFSH